MHRYARAIVVVLSMVAAVTVVAAARPAWSQPQDLAAVRVAVAKFQDLAMAEDAGYGLFTDAAGIACIDHLPAGAMGVHYVNGVLAGNPTIDALEPEALVYEPVGSALHLVAVEYVAFQADWDMLHSSPPTLFGQRFVLTPAGNRYGLPAFYSLHVWLWKDNPSGLFSMWSPRVTCEAASQDQRPQSH